MPNSNAVCAFFYSAAQLHGSTVQGFMADEVDAPNDVYKTVKCVACQLFQLVNPKTGRAAWDNSDADASAQQFVRE